MVTVTTAPLASVVTSRIIGFSLESTGRWGAAGGGSIRCFDPSPRKSGQPVRLAARIEKAENRKRKVERKNIIVTVVQMSKDHGVSGRGSLEARPLFGRILSWVCS